MSDRDYIAWSLLLAGAFALLLAILGRFATSQRRPPLERRRERLERELGDQLALRHSAEAGNIQDTIARLDAFAARHPALGRTLAALDRIHQAIGIVGLGFVSVALWTGRLGSSNDKLSPYTFLIPYLLIGMLIESIPPYGVQWRGALVVLGLLAAFAVPLAVISQWVP